MDNNEIIGKTYTEIKYDEDKVIELFYNPYNKTFNFDINCFSDEQVFGFWLDLDGVNKLIETLNNIKEQYIGK